MKQAIADHTKKYSSVLLEYQKMKRTGYAPVFFAGGLLSAAFPVINTAFRPEQFVNLPGRPLEILLEANWSMMCMFNLLLIVCGACIMYHTEYADCGAQKMSTLPVKADLLFFGKFGILALSVLGILLLEIASLVLCILLWFPGSPLDFLKPAENIGYAFVLVLPTVMLMLVIASVCRNMWVSLGCGVLLVSSVSIFPTDHFLLSLCPFATPQQMLHMSQPDRALQFFCIAAAETILLGIIEHFIVKLRRLSQ